MTTILCIAGSARADSFNGRLLGAAIDALRKRDCEVDVADTRALAALPMMDEDLEARDGLPPAVRPLKQRFSDADGVLLACPEYNGSITPLLKNVIDWVSRPDEALPASRCFADKPMALISASPGGLGGLRGLRHTREILGNLAALVVPAQFALGGAGKAFAENGSLVDPGKAKALDAVVDSLLYWVRTAEVAR